MLLTSALDGIEWSVSRSGRFTPGTQLLVSIEQELGVELRVSLYVTLKGRIFADVGNRNPILWPVSSHTD